MRSLVLAWVAALCACKATPTLDGEPLTCSRDTACPEEMRCFRGGCITNSPPTIEPLGLYLAGTNETVSVTASTNDAESDAVTVTWSLVYHDTAPPPDTHVGPTLTVATADSLTTWVFEVVADDGYDATVTYLTLIVADPPPPGQVVYVSKAGTDSDACGAIATPCATITRALGHGNNVAVAADRTPYAECLPLAGSATVWGGFDAGSWRFDPTLISGTEIVCDTDGDTVPSDPDLAAIGHLLADSSILGHATLRLRPTATDWPAEYFATVGVSGTAIVRTADVIAPAVPPPAIPAGVFSDATDGRLLGVNVRGDPTAADPPGYSLGVGIGAGTLTLESLAGRGEVAVNTPSTIAGVGVQNIGAQVVIDGIQIRGGLAGALIGVLGSGGVTTVRNTEIDLRTFGTVIIEGILSEPDCKPSAGDVCTEADQPTLVAENNLVRIHGPAESFVGTCLGIGVNHRALSEFTVPATRITNNTIEADGDIGLTVGMSVSGGNTTVAGNSVTIAGSLVRQAGCASYNASMLPSSPTFEGAIAISLEGGTGDRLADNTVTVHPRVSDVFGVFLADAEGAVVRENRITVAGLLDPGRDLYSPATGVQALNTADAAPSTLARNDVVVGPHAGEGVALHLRGAMSWHVTNNRLHGGETRYNTGLRVDVFRSTVQWPKVAYNTVFGGTGLVSTAVRFGVERDAQQIGNDVFGSPAGPIGMFINNLLDAGDGSERRFLFDNRQGGTELASSATTNVAQLIGATRPPPATSSTLFTVDPGNPFGHGRLLVALPDSGTLAKFRIEPDHNGDLSAGQESWLPTAYPFDAIWMGNTEATTTSPLVITGAAGRLTIGHLWGATEVFTTYLLPEEIPAAPQVLTFGEGSGAAPLDVVFATAAGATPGKLWIGIGSGAAGETIAALYPVPGIELVDPGFIGLSQTDPDRYTTDRVWLVDEPATNPQLRVWPAVDTTAMVLPTRVTSFAVGRVVATEVDQGKVHEEQLVAAAGFPDGGHGIYLTSPDDVMAPQSVALSGTWCPDGSTGESRPVSAVALCRGWCKDLWVGCENGRVEAYSLSRSGGIWQLTRRFEADLETGLPVRSLSVSETAVVVTYVDSDTVTWLKLLNNESAAQPPSPISVSLLGDVGLRTGTYADANALPGGWTTEPTAGPCNLRLRTEPGAQPPPHLLGLTDPAGGCDDYATPLDGSGDFAAVSVDFDGDARDPGTPDVGADER